MFDMTDMGTSSIDGVLHEVHDDVKGPDPGVIIWTPSPGEESRDGRKQRERS